MPDSPDIKALSAATYAATADHFDAPALSFWDRFGRRTVARIGLRPGDRVLDACCGTGASALPAAHLVGATGRVTGIDLAEPALVLARAKAVDQGLSTVDFRAVDVEHTGLPSESYDAVVCVFGIFFLPDMEAGVAELWRLVRPGGTLAVTVWGPDLLEPATGAFWAAVGAGRPDLVGAFRPWTRVTDAAALSRLFQRAGAATPTVETEEGTHPLADPGDWWTIVLGTGYRATVERLDVTAAQRVRDASVGYLRSHQVREVRTNVVYARAKKSAVVSRASLSTATTASRHHRPAATTVSSASSSNASQSVVRRSRAAARRSKATSLSRGLAAGTGTALSRHPVRGVEHFLRRGRERHVRMPHRISHAVCRLDATCRAPGLAGVVRTGN